MTRAWRAAALLVAAMIAAPAAPANGAGLTVSPEARQALDTLYRGDVPGSIAIAQKIQSREPESPVGYLLESEALWWVRYCNAVEIKYGMVEAWKRSREPDDERLLRLADKAIEVAESHLARQESAEMHFYKGMGWVLKVRVDGVRGDYRLAARAAVNGRSEMIRALELDPDLADATAMLGLYNYYVDTLSPIVKLLRFFMGIPGGNKETGVKQMETGMTRGVVLNVDIRFILARALRQYDQKYAEALGIAEPLVARYPQNPNFLLLLGNLNAELGRNPKASEYFHTVLNLPAGSACAAHCRDLANSFIATLH